MKASSFLSCLLVANVGITLSLRAELPDALSALAPAVSQRIEVMSFYSHALEKTVPFTIILPAPEESTRPWPCLFLLHGRGRSHLSLIEDPVSLPVLLKQPFATVLPMGFDGWYINSPVNPETKYNDALVELEALVAREHPVQKERNSRAIIGWSMGGFGAIYHAATHANHYGFAGAIIGLLDFPSGKAFPKGQSYTIPLSVFGEDRQVWKEFNPTQLIPKLRDTRLHLIIGENAFDRTMNENFLQAARREGLRIETHRLPHAHTFDAVQTGLPLILDAVVSHFEEQGLLNTPSSPQRGNLPLNN